jgi:epoxyqueuosine reductase
MDSGNKQSLSELIKSEALRLGFYSCGISKADYLENDADKLRNWLDYSQYARMEYMANHFEKRTDPRKLMEGAKSVISVLLNYFPQASTNASETYKIARYAYGTDYHFVLKRKLKQLIAIIRKEAGDVNARAFTDSAPVLDRAWAVRGGLGWIGKNTCLITKEQGSYFFIGEIICDLELEYNNYLEPDHCGGCTRCLDSCPTGALKPNQLDANLCISYWTIENKSDEIPESFAGKFQDNIFGCDICQDVCPWNRLSEPHNEPEFSLSEGLQKMKKNDWEELNPDQYQKLFRNSPIKRAGYNGLNRNIMFVSARKKGKVENP